MHVPPSRKPNTGPPYDEASPGTAHRAYSCLFRSILSEAYPFCLALVPIPPESTQRGTEWRSQVELVVERTWRGVAWRDNTVLERSRRTAQTSVESEMRDGSRRGIRHGSATAQTRPDDIPLPLSPRTAVGRCLRPGELYIILVSLSRRRIMIHFGCARGVALIARMLDLGESCSGDLPSTSG